MKIRRSHVVVALAAAVPRVAVLLHERITAGRAAVIARLAQALPAGSNLPDPELSAHMLSAYADEAARLTLQGYSVERILDLTRWALRRLRG